MKMFTSVLHFKPYFKPVIWGGTRIATFKGVSTEHSLIGESWEISAVPGYVSVVDRGPLTGKSLTELVREFGAELVGEENFNRFGEKFPLLVKLLDANTNVSVQIHPNDSLAMQRHNCSGKTEIWHIVDTTPDAKIYVGLKEKLTPDEYERRVADNSIMDAIATYDSAPGDTFFIPAGRIHAIGAGNLIAEIQETSDITYRIYDYDRRDKDGKPRKLHLAEAREAIDFTVSPDYKSHPTDSTLVDCPHFVVDKINLGEKTVRLPRRRESFTIVMCLGGEAEIACSTAENQTEAEEQIIHIKQGETLLFPATLRVLNATGNADLLSAQA